MNQVLMKDTMLKVKPKNNKVLFISDVHLGVHQNSSIWHKTAIQLAEWVAVQMEESGLDTIFFAGDVFHDRHEIGVNTLHVAKQFFEKLDKYNIYILPGNHDSFLSHTVEINSIEILAKSNITVFKKPTTIQVCNKLVTFCPWKTDISLLEPVDMLVGHFEITNFKMSSKEGAICSHGETATSLLQKSQCVVTGHFHYRDHKQYNENKYILYLGSPYEMDFGDRGQNKGVTIIDFTDLTNIEFVINNVTPKHYRIKTSDLIAKKHKNISELINKNIVSLYVDTKFDALTLDLLITKLTQYEPLIFRTEFDVLETAQVDTNDIQKFSLDIETAFSEFIELIDTLSSKKDVLSRCLELYKNSQISYE